MPIYEYRCSNCQERFELLCNTFESNAEVKCPKCGQKKAERIITTPFSKKSQSSPSTSESSCAPKSFG